MPVSRRRDWLFFGEYLGLLLLALAWAQLQHVRAQVGDRMGLLYALDAAAVAYVLLRGWLVMARGVTGAWDYLFLAVDLAIISGFVRLTGGVNSEVALTYLWPLATAATTRSPGRTLAVCVAIGVAYTAAVLPGAHGPDYLVHLAVRLLLLALVAALAFAYSRAEAERAREVARLREEAVVADFRTRLQHEIHDAIEERLAQIGARLDRLCALAEDSPQELRQGLETLRQDVGGAARDLRTMIRKARGGDEEPPR
jgi:signal transduction histidine kinase